MLTEEMLKRTVLAVDIDLAVPDLTNNTADAERLVSALKNHLGASEIRMDIRLIRRIPSLLRSGGFSLTCILLNTGKYWQLLDVRHPGDAAPVAGAAVDLGTTRIAVSIFDLVREKKLAECSFENPQASVAPDILARIHYSEKNDGLERLRKLAAEGIAGTVSALCAECGIRREDVYMVALAGNTAMTHLFLGIDPRWMIREPYIPAVNTPGFLPAAQLGLGLNAGAVCYVFPNIGSYFGGDLIAGILKTGIYRDEDVSMLVDVGTNAEVILGCRHWLVACAGAAGSALEMAVEKDLCITAEDGAIDRISFDGESGRFAYHTIGDKAPKGICGSGMIDLVAAMFESGMIDVRGKFVRERCGDFLQKKNGIDHLVIVPEKISEYSKKLSITPAGIDSFIRSKAAMYTILETIADTVGIDFKEIDTFYVAGTFGSFINPESAITIGMLPDLPRDRFRPVGNTSLGGAQMVLLSNVWFDDTDKIRDRITYLELNVNQDFMNRFSGARFLPHTDKNLFPSVKAGRTHKEENA